MWKKAQKQIEERRRERLLLICSAVVRGRCLRLRSHYLLGEGWVRRWNLQVADSKATQFIRDCKYEPDKYVLCHVPHLMLWMYVTEMINRNLH